MIQVQGIAELASKSGATATLLALARVFLEDIPDDVMDNVSVQRRVMHTYSCLEDLTKITQGAGFLAALRGSSHHDFFLMTGHIIKVFPDGHLLAPAAIPFSIAAVRKIVGMIRASQWESRVREPENPMYITNFELAEALQHKLQFTVKECMDFDIPIVGARSCIRSKNIYFQPAAIVKGSVRSGECNEKFRTACVFVAHAMTLSVSFGDPPEIQLQDASDPMLTLADRLVEAAGDGAIALDEVHNVLRKGRLVEIGIQTAIYHFWEIEKVIDEISDTFAITTWLWKVASQSIRGNRDDTTIGDVISNLQSDMQELCNELNGGLVDQASGAPPPSPSSTDGGLSGADGQRRRKKPWSVRDLSDMQVQLTSLTSLTRKRKKRA